MLHDAQYMCVERRNLACDIHMPNQIGGHGFSCHRGVPHGFGNHENRERQ
jgi:hypothetical protein